MKRYEDLVERDFASRQQVDQQRALVDQYRAQIDSDQAQIDYAQTQLGYHDDTLANRRPRGDTPDRPGQFHARRGQLADRGDHAVAADFGDLHPGGQFGRARQADTGPDAHTGGCDGGGRRTKLDEGTIDLVDNQVDQSTGTIKLKASFPESRRCVCGRATSSTAVSSSDERKDGVTVPAAALRHGPRGDFVWVVSNEQKAELRSVTAGQAIDGRVLIERGLKIRRAGGHRRTFPSGGRRSSVEIIHHDAGRAAAAQRLKPASVHVCRPFILRPIATTLLTIAVLMLGLLGYRLLPVAALPDVDFPRYKSSRRIPARRQKWWKRRSPRRWSINFGQISGLTGMTSTSAYGTSQITLTFNLSRSIDAAAQDVQASIDAQPLAGFRSRCCPGRRSTMR